MMDGDGPPKTAEYQDGDVTVLSRAPLRGHWCLWAMMS
jgi:hypothetical protein